MLHIFVDPAQMKGDLLYVTGKDVNHIKNVMRLKQGDEISVRTGQDDREYRYGVPLRYRGIYGFRGGVPTAFCERG